MGFIDKLNRLIELYLSTIRNAGKIGLWIPFFVYSVLQFLLLWLLTSYVNPSIYPVLSPPLGLAAGKQAPLFSHYPALFLMLPMIFQWGKLILGVLFEGLASGITALMFATAFSKSNEINSPYKTSISRWPQLLIAWTCITAFLLVVNWLLPDIFAGLLQSSPRRIVAFEILMQLFTVLLYSIFVYAVPAIVVYDKGVWQAFAVSMRFFARYPIFSFFLAFIPFLISVPTTYLSSKSSVIVDKFSPELVFYILLIGIVADLLVNFFTTGAVVKFLVEEKE